MPIGPTASKTASADETMRAVNDACRRRGGVYATYSCKNVSWDDSSRGHNATGGLSCVGPNITDTYLKAKDGMRLFTVRPDNWNEKLGTLSSSEIAVVAGGRGGVGGAAAAPPRPITLCDLLKSMGEYGSYAGLPAICDLSSDALDGRCSVRFQATFLPARTPAKKGLWGPPAGGREALEFATEAYNYQTASDDDPKNLVLLCTTQGAAVQADGSGATRLYHHSVDAAGNIHRHWLEAERTGHAVGGPQAETEAERADAVARGKATACVIGPRALGTRFNVLMTVQVPLRQKHWRTSGQPIPFGAPPPAPGGSLFGAPLAPPGAPPGAPPAPSGMYADGFCCSSSAAAKESSWVAAAAVPAPLPASGFAFSSAPPPASGFAFSSFGSSRPPPAGSSNAARVSVGTEHDVWLGLRGNARNPRRHESERVTVTIVLYNVVAGGVPSEGDVTAAIDDLEELYRRCRAMSRSEASYANAPAVTSNPFLPTPKALLPAVTNYASFPSPMPPPTANGGTASGQTVQSILFQNVPQDLIHQIRSMPLSHATFTYAHNLGLERLNLPSPPRATLAEAFGLFDLANELHVRLYSIPAHSALYNVACVASKMAATAAAGGPAATMAGGPLGGSADRGACLDVAATWLLTAAAAGANHAHMSVDEDLAEIRAGRPAKFTMAVQIAQAVEQSG